MQFKYGVDCKPMKIKLKIKMKIRMKMEMKGKRRTNPHNHPGIGVALSKDLPTFCTAEPRTITISHDISGARPRSIWCAGWLARPPRYDTIFGAGQVGDTIFHGRAARTIFDDILVSRPCGPHDI